MCFYLQFVKHLQNLVLILVGLYKFCFENTYFSADAMSNLML